MPADDGIERLSAVRDGGPLSPLADRDELRFREELEPEADIVAWIHRKELPQKLEYALRRARIEPRGTVIDLGAGYCWMSAELAKRPAVERVIAIEFSRRRLERAPVAIAHLGAPAEKIERVVADFYAPGLGDEVADMVFMDAAFHHASDPGRLARVAYDLLRPGGIFVLHREPSLALLRRSRPHGIEGEHGHFEHEYYPREYLTFLRGAGFDARRVPTPWTFRRRLARAWMRPPLSLLNGIAGSSYTYVGHKPVNPPAG